MTSVNERQVLDALRGVKDPDLGRDVVSLGFVKNLRIDGGRVAFDLELTTPACPMKDRMKNEATMAVSGLPGVESVDIRMTAQVRGRAPAPQERLPGVKNVIAVASGKGGVGKSTVATNLAVALARTGASVGLMDADVYGPSVSKMLGLSGRPEVVDGNRLVPMEAHGIRAISMGMLADENTPVIWRGPIASRLIQQFLDGVAWGELDYLVIDLPPGTGDIQLTLCQHAPLSGAVIVTTPQEVATEVSRKGLLMFGKVNVPILGVVENMSSFVCPSCEARHPIFGEGGGRRIAAEGGIPFLGEIPLDPATVAGGDAGTPVTAARPDSPAAAAFREIAGNLAAQLSIRAAGAAPGDTVPGPERLKIESDGLRIRWTDGLEQRFPLKPLRLACPCAHCVDETTGRRKVTEDQIPGDVGIQAAAPIGNYALQITWSDGHSTGLYPYVTLRESGERLTAAS